jgi:uncharacterized protein (TIGR02996 family)
VWFLCPGCGASFGHEEAGAGEEVRCPDCQQACLAPPDSELPTSVPDCARQLFEAVEADPAADGPRLVLADALTERGDPLGEFIAIQVTAAGGRTKGLARHRENELLRAYRSRWVPPGVEAGSAVFSRGLLQSCTWQAPTDPAHWGWRMVEVLHCSGVGGVAPGSMPFARSSLPSLQTVTGVRGRCLAAMAQCALPHLTHLQVVTPVTDFLKQQLPFVARFPALEVLDLGAEVSNANSADDLRQVAALCMALAGQVKKLRLFVRRSLQEEVFAQPWHRGLGLTLELVDPLFPDSR